MTLTVYLGNKELPNMILHPTTKGEMEGYLNVIQKGSLTKNGDDYILRITSVKKVPLVKDVTCNGCGRPHNYCVCEHIKVNKLDEDTQRRLDESANRLLQY